ncbi:MAG: hypothetical protein AAGH67_16265 [Cyanobacteria bacterium P01_H01_bin.162]
MVTLVPQRMTDKLPLLVVVVINFAKTTNSYVPRARGGIFIPIR